MKLKIENQRFYLAWYLIATYNGTIYLTCVFADLAQHNPHKHGAVGDGGEFAGARNANLRGGMGRQGHHYGHTHDAGRHRGLPQGSARASLPFRPSYRMLPDDRGIAR